MTFLPLALAALLAPPVAVPTKPSAAVQSAPASAAPTAPPTAAPAAPIIEVWGGRQTVLGIRTIPLLGDYETRTDLWLLTRVARTADRWEVRYVTCGVQVADVAGTSIHFPAHAFKKLPIVAFHLTRDPDGSWHAPSFKSGWGEEDYDGDGWGGLTLTIDAPVCDGKLGIVSDSRNTAQVKALSDRKLDLDLLVRIGQKTVESEGWCLRFADKQSDDRFHGKATFDVLPDTATCTDVLKLPTAMPPAED